MERGFSYNIAGDDYGSGNLFQAKTEEDVVSDEANFNALFSGVSLQSFLTLNLEPNFIPSLLTDLLALPSFPTSSSPMSFNFATESSSSSSHMAKLPKMEPLSLRGNITESTHSFNLMHKMSDSRPPTPTPFHLLPDLRSLEQQITDSSFSQKRARIVPSLSQAETLDSIVQSCINFQNFTAPYNYQPLPEVKTPAPSPTEPIPRSAFARQRRQTLSDKTRCLQKLLPWDKKMDMATMLEEAYKYVKFLQAQVSVLQLMPNESSMDASGTQRTVCSSGSLGGLSRLSRNQLLQVLVNSPVAQTRLYSQGCCVFSAEQLVQIQKIVERKVLLQQMAFSPNSEQSAISFHGGFNGQ